MINTIWIYSVSLCCTCAVLFLLPALVLPHIFASRVSGGRCDRQIAMET